MCWALLPLDWEERDTEMAGGKPNLWEESWDDDDSSEDFSAQLRQVSRCKARKRQMDAYLYL